VAGELTVIDWAPNLPLGERLLILVGLNLLLWAALLGLWWLGGREPRRRH
jgi:hypothetical protein